MKIQQEAIIHEDHERINRLEDLHGKEVYVRRGTSYEERLHELKEDGEVPNRASLYRKAA